MTKSQKLALELSEKRQRTNELLGKDELTPEERAELEVLTTRLQEAETEYRAAVTVEAQEEAEARGQFGNNDGESAELRGLLDRATINDYLIAAGAGTGITGAAAELNAALEIPLVGNQGGPAVPWDLLLTPELRAFTDTGDNAGPEMQRPILQRLFGAGIMDALGVRIDTVPVGRTEWPLLNSGVAPAQVVEGTAAAAAVNAGFLFANLKPKRLTGVYEYTHEIAASVADLEQAIRRDLADAIKSAMSNAIINGAAVDPNDAATAANVEGFISELTQADDTAVADAARYGRLHAQAVDGIHASKEGEVMSIIGDETYQHAAGVYIAGSGESGSELLSRRSAGCMASTYIPDAASDIQPAILHAAGPNGGGMMRGDSVAAMWPTLEIVRDIYTKASSGIILTWITLWDTRVALRSSAYRLIGLKLA